jgi:hypothetical protein
MKEILEMKRIHDRMVKRRQLRDKKRQEEATGITSGSKPDPYSLTKKKNLKPAAARY